jgi:hypothetical protein
LPAFEGCGEGVAASFEFGFILRTDHGGLGSLGFFRGLGEYPWRALAGVGSLPLAPARCWLPRARRGSGAARWTTPIRQRGYLGAIRGITYEPPQRDLHRPAADPSTVHLPPDGKRISSAAGLYITPLCDWIMTAAEQARPQRHAIFAHGGGRSTSCCRAIPFLIEAQGPTEFP